MRRLGRSRPDPKPCLCGATYDKMRTGLTYKQVRRGMDPDRWKGRRRSSVLGYWREQKLAMWDHLHANCTEQDGGSIEDLERAEQSSRRRRRRAA